jgi:tetratricopeptide (TPR) repeat protein
LEAYQQELRRASANTIVRQQEAAAASAQTLVPELRAQLASNPRAAVDRLNGGALGQLVATGRFAEAEEFAVSGIIASARDTWKVEQLQRMRVHAFRLAGKKQEALSAARGLFNVAGLGSVPHDLKVLAEVLRDQGPDGGVVSNRFKLQQLAGAHTDDRAREKAMEGLGKNVLLSIEVDGSAFAKAIESRRGASDYDGLYALGNLLLVAGRIEEAKDAFKKADAAAPAGEINYITEGLAKVMKAEDGCIGRANSFVGAVYPK